MKKNKKIIAIGVAIVAIIIIAVIVIKQAEEPVAEPAVDPAAEPVVDPAADPAVDPAIDGEVTPAHQWWLDEAFFRLEAEVTEVNVAESYLMVKPLFPPMPEEIKVKISPGTIIEQEKGIEKTIKDIEKGYFVFFENREDIREKTEIFQFEWFAAFPPLDEPLDIIEPLLPDGEEQWWLEQEIFNLTGEVIEVNLGENYLRVKPISPPLEQEIRVILEPGFTFEDLEMVTPTINDISVRDLIIFDTGEDIREKQVIEKVIRIQLFGDLLH